MRAPHRHPLPATGTWVIDPAHTNLGFSARHAMVAKVRGNFGDFSGTFTIDGENLANSKAELTIQAASIITGPPTATLT